jgi:uncharacterized membrane protein
MKRTFRYTILIMTIIIFVIIILTYLFSINISSQWSIRGTFGDWFGGILNPIFSLASFILIAITLKIQIDQINNNENDMKQNLKLIRIDYRENTFSNMLTTLPINNPAVRNHIIKNIREINEFIPSIIEDTENEKQYKKNMLNKLLEENYLVEYDLMNNQINLIIDFIVKIETKQERKEFLNRLLAVLTIEEIIFITIKNIYILKDIYLKNALQTLIILRKHISIDGNINTFFKKDIEKCINKYQSKININELEF